MKQLFEGRQRFSIRKFSFGAASVLLGTVFLAQAPLAHAEEIGNPSGDKLVKDVTAKSDSEESKSVDAATQPETFVTKEDKALAETPAEVATTPSVEATIEKEKMQTPSSVPATAEKTALPKAETPAKTPVSPAQAEEKRVSDQTVARLTEAVKDLEEHQAKAAESEKVQEHLANAKQALQNPQVSSAELKDVLAKTSTIRNRVVNASLRATSGARDSRNGQAMAPASGVAFRANPTVGEAVEGPTNNNKRGYGVNPTDNVISSMQHQFGDIDFSDAVSKSTKVEKQWNNSSQYAPNKQPVDLGEITYNWKEKKIYDTIDGWKIEGTNNYVTAIKGEAPTGLSANRPSGNAPYAAKVYDNNGSIERKYNTTPAEKNPLGVDNSLQNYANGVNNDAVVRPIEEMKKGYYLELGKKGTKISKEFAVNPNSRVYISTLTGGAYGNAGTAATGEKVKITLTDAVTGEVIPTIVDSDGNSETSHISSPGNPTGWSYWRTIINTPKTTNRIKITIEAENDGTAFKNTYPVKDKEQIEDGYFVAGVNIAVGGGLEITTDVKTGNTIGRYGEDNIYKRSQEGELNITVKNVGGIGSYNPYEITVTIPEGVNIKDNYKQPNNWVWPGPAQVISYDESTRVLKLRIQERDAGPVPNKSRTLGVAFTTADDFKGTSTFKVTAKIQNGFTDLQGNVVLENVQVVYNDSRSQYRDLFNAIGNSSNPDYAYNKTIYIDTKKPTVVAAEAVHTDHIIGDAKDQKQAKRILITPPTEDGLTSSEKEQANIAELNKLNGTTTTVEKIEEALGGVKSMTVTLPNGASAITLEKKDDGWYQGNTKLSEEGGKLVLPLPENVNLDEANETTNPDKRIKITAMDKAGNISDPAYVNIINNAPEIKVAKKDIYMYKTKANLTSDDIVTKVEATSTDLEDDRDGVESTKPKITTDTTKYDTTMPGNYSVTLTATDSEGKTATDSATIHVYDLITVDPTVTTDPTDPSTTTPVSPKAENTPVKEGDNTRGTYPSGITMNDLVKEVTRTIKYLKEADKDNDSATPLHAEKVQKVTYKRTATVNPDTKEVAYSDWTVYEGADKLVEATKEGKFNSVTTPVVKGYLLVTAGEKTIEEAVAPKPSADKAGTVMNEVKKVLYKELGAFVPTYPDGKKPNGALDKIPYPNHETDPSIPGDFSTITIPYVPGYTPVINGVELTPKTPNDPRDGYAIVSNPNDNFANTPVTYTPSVQKVTVYIRTKDGENEEEHFVKEVELTGRAGAEIPKDNKEISDKIAELEGQGYKVTTNTYAEAGKFDDKDDIVPKDKEDATNEGAEGQTFEVILTARTETVTPDAPKEKDGLVDGDKHPNLKWSEGVAKDNLNKDVTRTISFVKKDTPTSNEEKAKDDLVQPVHFKRSAEVNLVTKKVTYKDWMTDDKNFPVVKVDVLKGYLADKKEVPAAEATTPTKDGDVTPLTEKVTYTKIGTWIPVKPGEVNPTPIPYPNDPTDPTKPGEITEIIPYVPGYTPKDKDGQPLKEKNPGHPEDGYIPPKITNPNENITINYEKDDQKVTVKFVSVDPKTKVETELTSEELSFTGKTGEAIDSAKITEKLVELDKHGYDKGENPFDTPQTFDDKKDEADKPSQVFVVKVTPRVSTVEPVYVVEGEVPTADEANAGVKPAAKGTATPLTAEDITKAIPTTEGKGGQILEIPAKVTYGDDANKRTEEVKVPVVVLPKAKAEGVVVPKGTGEDILKEAIKEKAKEAAKLINLPEGVTAKVPEDDNIMAPATTEVGDKGEVEVTVNYVTSNGKQLRSSSVKVPVTVFESKVTPLVVFEGDEITTDMAKGAVSETHGGEVQKPTSLPLTEGKAGATDVKASVIVKHKVGNKEVEENVEVPVTVLPLPKPELEIVVKNSDKDALREKVKENVRKAIANGDFKGKLPQGATVELDTTKEIEIPDLTDDTEVYVPLVYTVDGRKYTTKAEVPVEVVEGYPQYVPANEDNTQPNVENSIDKGDYPEGSTFKYKETVDTKEAGLKDVVVVVTNNGETIAEVPAKVAVVESTPRYIVQTETKEKLSSPEKSITPEEYPDGARFEYDGDVDTTTLGEQKVNVVVKTKDGQPIVTVPATVTVVAGTDKYVPVSKEKLQPNPKEQITPDDYPLDATYEYKDPIDTTTKGNKGATVVVKDENGKVLVEVPVTVKVVEGKTVTVPANDKETPKPEENIVPSDYPNGATFEYKTPVDITTVGEKAVVVVVKDKDGKILVEVPGKVLVVDGVVTPIETPVTTTPLEASDLEKYVKVPEGGKITKVGEIPSFTTPGTKPEIEVEITLENGKKIVKKVPVTVTPVSPIETPVTTTPLTKEDVSKHIKIPEGGSIISIGEIPGVDMPGQKKPITVVVELPGGKRITVEVPVTVTPVRDIETPVTTTPLTPEDISKQIQIPEGGKVISVGKVPGVDTAGDKGRVTVVVELPDGKRVEIPVHVTVTPITPIQVPQGTPITETDVQKHIKIPEGGKIISIGDIPTTETAGHKPSVPIVIELPGGKQIRVEVPVDVTPITQVPTDSPIQPALPEIAFADGEELVVPQYSAIGEQDILKRVHVPEGGKVIQMTALPSTETPGRKPAVEVIVELSEGHLLRVLVPVLVTPVQQEHMELEMPKRPTASAQQSAKPAVSAMASEQQVKKELPNTGSTSSLLSTLGLFGFFSGFGLALKSRKDEE